MVSIKNISMLLLLLFYALYDAVGQDMFELEILFTDHNEELKDEINYNSQLFSEEEIGRQLGDVYEQLYGLGYLKATKDSCKYDTVEIRCFLNPGKKFRYFISPGNLGEEALDNLSHRDYFSREGISPQKYEMLTKEILGFFQNNGYPFSKVSLDNVNIENDSIIGALNIDTSYHIVFDTLKVNGDVSINPRFLAMHTGVKSNNSYSEDVIENIGNKIEALGFVALSDEPEVVFTKAHATVNVGIERRSANRFDGIAGVMYDERADKAMRLTGQLNLYLINTLERAEWMDLKWQGLGFGTQTLDISAGYPYIFYTPFSAEMQFSMRKQDTTYIQVKRKPALEYRFAGNVRAKVFVDWRTSELIDVSRYERAAELPDIIDYKTIFYGVGTSYTSGAFHADPRRGFDYSLQIAAGSRDIKKNNNLPAHLYDDVKLKSTQYTGEVSLQRIFPFMDRSAMLIKGEGGMLAGDEVFDNELFRVGGINSLRGFDEESVLASAYGFLLAEYRYVAGRNTYLSLFANSGYIEKNSASGYYKDWPLGVGAGVSQELPAGMMSLFFATGKRQNEPFDLNDIKVHVGFVSTF